MGSGIEYISASFYGYHDIFWLQFYAYIIKELDVKANKSMDGLYDLSKEAGWCYCYENIAFITDRAKIKLDESGKLHSENGFAFEFPDGFGDTYWHGTRIPNDIIFEKDKLTPERIFNESNKELQRCMLDLYGREKMIENEGIMIDTDNWGSLYHMKNVKDSFKKPLAFLKVTNFSPNESIWLSKKEIDDIFLRVQKRLKLSNYSQRHGDVVIINKYAKILKRKEAEQKIKKFQSEISIEIDILRNKKNITEKETYKEYYLQVNPSIKTAYEAWQSCTKRLHKSDFLPIVAS